MVDGEKHTKRRKTLPDISVDKLFMDSGAHSLWGKHVGRRSNKKGYKWFDSKPFWDYVDNYANFIKKYRDVIDYYANVDVIFDPKRSWYVLKYLEDKHKLQPVPVLHWNCDLIWLQRHLDAGYDYIGLGGLGQGITKSMYLNWSDDVFEYLCPGPTYSPRIRVHGFAMTAYDLMLRYPWWSVDSASWTKVGAFGDILVPHKRKGCFTFDIQPYIISVSEKSEKRGQDKHYRTLSPKAKKIVDEWLTKIDIPLGKRAPDGTVIEEGVTTRHSERKAANLFFFEAMRKWLPCYEERTFRRPEKRGQERSRFSLYS